MPSRVFSNSPHCCKVQPVEYIRADTPSCRNDYIWIASQLALNVKSPIRLTIDLAGADRYITKRFAQKLALLIRDCLHLGAWRHFVRPTRQRVIRFALLFRPGHHRSVGNSLAGQKSFGRSTFWDHHFDVVAARIKHPQVSPAVLVNCPGPADEGISEKYVAHLLGQSSQCHATECRAEPDKKSSHFQRA